MKAHVVQHRTDLAQNCRFAGIFISWRKKTAPAIMPPDWVFHRIKDVQIKGWPFKRCYSPPIKWCFMQNFCLVIWGYKRQSASSLNEFRAYLGLKHMYVYLTVYGCWFRVAFENFSLACNAKRLLVCPMLVGTPCVSDSIANGPTSLSIDLVDDQSFACRCCEIGSRR